jgi:two-component system CitB family sensor kinase
VGVILAKATIAAERGLVLEVCDGTCLGKVSALEQALTTILGNLIDNAIDALSTPDVVDRQGRVRVSIIEESGAVDIRVEDNGPGIPSGSAARIFTDGYSTKPSEGLLRRGLGLVLVHRIVQRLGGTITASVGPGAVFAVNLPKEAA